MQFPTIHSVRQLSYYPKMMKESLIPKNEALPSDSSNQRNLESLRNKLKSGQKLTNIEMEYLKNHDPNLYNKALSMELERANYEISVRQYQTKSEVREYHTQKLMSILKPNHDPEESMMRISAIQDSHREFVQSNEYASLAWK